MIRFGIQKKVTAQILAFPVRTKVSSSKKFPVRAVKSSRIAPCWSRLGFLDNQIMVSIKKRWRRLSGRNPDCYERSLKMRLGRVDPMF